VIGTRTCIYLSPARTESASAAAVTFAVVRSMDTSTRDLNGVAHPTFTTDIPPLAILTAVPVVIEQPPLKFKHSLHVFELWRLNGKCILKLNVFFHKTGITIRKKKKFNAFGTHKTYIEMYIKYESTRQYVSYCKWTTKS